MLHARRRNNTADDRVQVGRAVNDARFSLQEVALLTNEESLDGDDFVLFAHGGGIRRLRMSHRCFDTWYYVLLFPYGDDGWHSDLYLVPLATDQHRAIERGMTSLEWFRTASDQRRRMTPRSYYAHRLHWRNGLAYTGGRRMLMGARLLQEYCCTAWSRTEAERLLWHRMNQATLRAETYENLRSELQRALFEGRDMGQVGRQVILGSSFVGGPRDTANRYQDAMAIIRETRRPSMFLTMTCNPKWPEIVRSIPYESRPEDHPEIVARVFHLKVEELMVDLKDKHVLGRVVGLMGTVEFQYRGLPHIHLLLVFDAADAALTEESIDNLVCCEIPPETTAEQRSLRQKVMQHMVHNDCAMNPGCKCCERTGKCRWNFPKPWTERTHWTDSSLYPTYRRRQAIVGNGPWPVQENGRVITNQWIAGYNAWLLEKYDCHLNVEVCASVEAVKYLYKYIYKGPDRAAVSAALRAAHRYDEVASFEDMRYFGAAECCWRLLKFSLYVMEPSVERLPLHLHNQQVVYHQAGQEQRAANQAPCSKLNDWLYFCCRPVTVPPLPADWQSLTFLQFPGYFTHSSRSGWRAMVQRTCRFRTVGRLPPIVWSVATEELYYLRVLLCHLTCGEVHDHIGQLPIHETPTLDHLKFGHSSFKEACRTRGLASDDTEWVDAVVEACATQPAHQLLSLVVFILAYNAPSNVDAIMDVAWASVAERSEADVAVARRLNVHIDQVRRVRAQVMVQEGLEACGGGPDAMDALQRLTFNAEQAAIRNAIVELHNEPAALRYELDYDRAQQTAAYEEKAALISQHPSQAAVLSAVQAAVRADLGGVFFISAYAGCGKTFLEQALLHWVRSDGHIALAVASTGIAALLLEGGNTLHAKLKAPLSPYTADSRLNISYQSAEGCMLRRAKLLIWDESVMHSQQLAHAVDMSLRDLRNEPNLPFGGLVVVWGGDFRQTLPIEERATTAQTISMCLHQWPLWAEHVTVMTLTENQRCMQLVETCADDLERQRIMRWKTWLEELGDGLCSDDEGRVALWGDQCHCISTESDFDRLLDDTYGTDASAFTAAPPSFWADRAIVTPKHSAVDYINQRMLGRLPVQVVTLLSADTLDLENGELDVGSDFLNRQQSGSMPPHRLQLKVGCVVMLLRNLDKRNGLVNGTRMLVRQITHRLLRGVILTAGSHQGKEVLIPRIRLKPRRNVYPFAWSRLQFPVKLSYAMTYATWGLKRTVHVHLTLTVRPLWWQDQQVSGADTEIHCRTTCSTRASHCQ